MAQILSHTGLSYVWSISVTQKELTLLDIVPLKGMFLNQTHHEQGHRLLQIEKQSQGPVTLTDLSTLAFQYSRKHVSPKATLNWFHTLLSGWFWQWVWPEDPEYKLISSQSPRYLLGMISYISINGHRTSPSCGTAHLFFFKIQIHHQNICGPIR